MKTQVLKPNKKAIKLAAEYIKNNQVIGFPTETVYGLGGNALSTESIEQIYVAKNRPADNPLIVHIASKEDLELIVEDYPLLVTKLIESFWPGPLSIVFKASKRVPKIVTAGLDTVAVRMPAHPIAREIIREAGSPIAAPSANISGRPSSTTAKHVYEDFAGKIPLIIDGGDCEFGLESTVILVGDKITILRPGAITKEMLERFSETEYKVFNQDGTPLSPGVKHPHYHPKAKIILLRGNKEEILNKVHNLSFDSLALFGREDYFSGVANENSLLLPLENFNYLFAAKLYSFFRQCDEKGVKNIVIHEVEKTGLGHAIMDRIEKASDIII
jgi:L-threonylcarbamoyladenylate synthase